MYVSVLVNSQYVCVEGRVWKCLFVGLVLTSWKSEDVHVSCDKPMYTVILESNSAE